MLNFPPSDEQTPDSPQPPAKPAAKLRRFDLDLCGNERHNQREYEKMARALGPYESKLANILRGESISVLFARGPVFLYLEDESPAGLISAALRTPQQALLSLYGNIPSEPIKAVADSLLPTLSKITLHLYVPRGQVVPPPAGFTQAGRLSCETLIDGRWIDMVILERLNPALISSMPQQAREVRPEEQPAPTPEQPADVPPEEPEDEPEVQETFGFEKPED